jgi:hypothetical protein
VQISKRLYFLKNTKKAGKKEGRTERIYTGGVRPFSLVAELSRLIILYGQKWVPVALFPDVKRSGLEADHSP